MWTPPPNCQPPTPTPTIPLHWPLSHLPFPFPLFTTHPFPFKPILFRCAWIHLVLLCRLCTNHFFLCFFPEFAVHCPMAVSVEENARLFRQVNEDQQLLGKCFFLFYYSCIIFMLYGSPAALHPPLRPLPGPPPSKPYPFQSLPIHPNTIFFSGVHEWILFYPVIL